MNPFADLDANFDQRRLMPQQPAQGGGMGFTMGPQNAMASPAPAQPQKKKKGFLVDNISTVGGIVGGIAGGVGGALGGFGVGGVPGAALGGAGGSALGELLENIIVGEDLGKNVLKEGVMGGVFGAGPLKLAKVGLGIPGQIASRGAGQSALNFAAKEGGEQVAERTLKTGFTGRLTDMGNKSLMSQYGTISKPVARATDPGKTIGKLADLDIYRPQDAERMAHALTGADGLLNQAVTKAIKGAGSVNLKTVPTVLDDALNNSGLIDTQAEGIRKIVTSQLKTIKPNEPESVLRVMRNLESKAADFLGKGGNSHLATSDDGLRASVLRAVRDELQDQLYNVGGANKNLANVLTPELREQLVNLGAKNSNWARYVDDVIMKADDVGKLRSAQDPFVKISKIIDEGDVNSITFGGRGGNLFNKLSQGGGLTGVATDVVGNVVAKPAARFAGKNLRDIGTGEIGNQSAKGILGTAATLGTTGLLSNAMRPSGDMNQMNQPQALEDVFGAGSNSQMNGEIYPNETPWLPDGTSGPLDPVTRQPLQQSSPYSKEALTYDINRDPQNADKYIAYYQQLAEIFGQPENMGMADMSQSSRNAMASSDNALNTITQLEQVFDQAGGGAGQFGGRLKNLAGDTGIDGNARLYNSLANGSVTQIAKALAGSGAGTVSDMDAKVIMAMLPRFEDSPEVARGKFQALKQRLDAARQNTMLYGGSVEEQLQQPQYGGLY